MFTKSAIKRVFLGLPVAWTYAQRLQQFVQQADMAIADQLIWMQPANYHVTLRFIGEVPAQKLSALTDAITMHLTYHHPIELEVTQLDHFPHANSKIIAAYLLLNEGLQILQQSLELAVRIAGVMPSHQTFKPHITLARLAKHLTFPVMKLKPSQLQNEQVNEFILYESVTQQGKHHYQPLQHIPLQINE